MSGQSWIVCRVSFNLHTEEAGARYDDAERALSTVIAGETDRTDWHSFVAELQPGIESTEISQALRHSEILDCVAVVVTSGDNDGRAALRRVEGYLYDHNSYWTGLMFLHGDSRMIGS